MATNAPRRASFGWSDRGRDAKFAGIAPCLDDPNTGDSTHHGLLAGRCHGENHTLGAAFQKASRV
jgi:hypothetical protein